MKIALQLKIWLIVIFIANVAPVFSRQTPPKPTSSTKYVRSQLVETSKLAVKRLGMLAKINQLRTTKSLGAISLDSKLSNAAQFMAEDMAKRNYMAHVTLSGLDISARVAIHGRKQFLVLRENIAAGNESIPATFKQWVDSPSHYNNLIANDIKKCGIGYAKGPKTTYVHYWVLDLGDFPN